MAKLKTTQNQSDERDKNQQKKHTRSEDQHRVILDLTPEVRGSDMGEDCSSQRLSCLLLSRKALATNPKSEIRNNFK